jgi:hypothetical protein
VLRVTISSGGRRLAAIAALVLVLLFALVGQAGADADQKLSISGPASIDEGGQATYTISLTDGTDEDATVVVTASRDPGTEASDLTEKAETLTVPKGGSKTFTVDVAADGVSEPDTESYSVKLSNPQRATIDTASVTTTINDRSPLPKIKEIRDVTTAEGNSGSSFAEIEVIVEPASERTITIDYAAAEGGTATPGSDYVLAPGRLTYEPGVTSQKIKVEVKGDTLFEPDETVIVSLVQLSNVAPADNGDFQGRVTIDDDDSALTPTVPDAEVEEGNSGDVDLVFKVTLGGPRPATTFNYRTVSLTANASDYVEVGGAQISFPAGADPFTRNVPIRIKVDTVDELDETLRLEILDPTKDPADPAAIVATAIGKIKNDDNNSKLAINDVNFDEPTDAPGSMKFTVTLLPASGREVSAQWSTANGTAAAGSDYTASSGTLVFAPGQTSKEIVVPVLSDSVNEENETFFVNLSGSGAVVGDPQGLGTIVDKNAPPSLSISDTAAKEGGGALFVVTLAGNTLRTVTVRFKTVDGSARAGSDYQARIGTLTFAPGEKTKELEVGIIDDPVSEGTEDFFMSIEDAVNATVTKANGRATIEANDQAATAGQSPTTNTQTPPTTAAPKTPVRVLAPRMVLGPRTVEVAANGIARMLITCQAASPITCAGSVELEQVGEPKHKVGKKAFSVKKGKKAYASIKLSARSLTLLRKSGSMRVRVIVVYKKTVGTGTAVPGIVTLTAPKAKPKPKAKAKTPAAKAKSAAEPPPVKVEILP